MAQNTFDFSYFWGKLSTILGGKANTSDLATVATSGSYNDLSDKPTIPPGAVVDQTYDATSQNAQAGTAVAEAISGLQSEITAQSPLDADLVDDTTSTHKFATAAQLSKVDGITGLTNAQIDTIMGS